MQLPPAHTPLPFRDDNARLLAELSHEIRTPLTAMLGYVELLLTSDADISASPTSREALAIIDASSRHLLDLVNGILDWSRLDAVGEVERVPTNPMAIAEEVARLLAVRIGTRDLRLHVVTDPATPREILSDPTRLRQILLNLVGNALKFTTAGEVRVQLGLRHDSQGNERLLIDVSDTGSGLTNAEIAQLFRPFAQSNELIQTQHGGTGLGLAISHRLCQLLDGELTVQSEVDVGSTFRVELPAVRCLLIEQDEAPVTRPGLVSLADSRIFLADDHPETRLLIARILRLAGAHVTEACDGREACELILAHPSRFTAVLFDLEMPIVDGYAACRELKARGCSAPIIAISAATDATTRAACQDAGFDAFAAKPVKRRDLLALLQRLQSALVT